MRFGAVSETAARIGCLAVRALLREVSAAPKPGLVDRDGTGSHDDMDFMTFSDSALALGPTFASLAREGLERGAAHPAWASADAGCASEARSSADAEFLGSLRKIGIEGEARMFAATGGVNTHKGALFLLGLQAAAVGALLGAGAGAGADRIRAFAARIARGVSERELPSASTHGARAFREHGSRGVRGEAESGLSGLDRGALRVLRRAFSAGRPDDADCIEALLSVMAAADDTTVLHRGGPEALRLVKLGAFRVLALGGLRTEEGRRELALFSAELVRRRISPGGSADLLAAGIFLANVERDFQASSCVRFPAAPRPRRLPRFQPSRSSLLRP